MDRKSTSEFEKKLNVFEGKIPDKYFQILGSFCHAYKEAVPSPEEADRNLVFFMQLLEELLHHPYAFEPYHKKIRHPIDYYRFGLDFIRPLIDLPHSRIEGKKHLEAVADSLKKGENVILLANHQTESDPQAISVMLEKTHPQIAESMIFVAGERVVTDPLAIPFSMGCDLLCIYSRRYIDHPIEEKAEKQLHNKKTMQLMSRLLSDGGKIIYVAPSGGRDRMGARGFAEVAPFDADSIEMFYLMARKAKTATHFVPLALATYDLLPPPETIQRELGELRIAKRTAIHLSFAPAFDMEHFQGSSGIDKKEKRELRCREIESIVVKNYLKLKSLP